MTLGRHDQPLAMLLHRLTEIRADLPDTHVEVLRHAADVVDELWPDATVVVTNQRLADPIVCEVEEIANSMRLLHDEVALMSDRFESVQRAVAQQIKSNGSPGGEG